MDESKKTSTDKGLPSKEHEDVLRPKLCPRLRNMLKQVALEKLSRVSQERLSQRAVPNIGMIELVSGDIFATKYDDLYQSAFPNRLERERSDLIVDRLRKDFAGRRTGFAPYRIVGIRDHDDKAIGAAQFSVLSLNNTLTNKSDDHNIAVPYLQYIYIRSDNRRQDMMAVLHTIMLAVSEADAAIIGHRQGKQSKVPFMFFETEPAGYGSTDEARATSRQRAQIHTKSGAVALMLRKLDNGALRTPHIQPGLEEQDPPVTLMWAILSSPSPGLEYNIHEIGESLVAAYYQSLRDEGFPPANIALAENIFRERCEGCDFLLMPLVDVVPNVEEYVPNTDGVSSA